MERKENHNDCDLKIYWKKKPLATKQQTEREKFDSGLIHTQPFSSSMDYA